MKEEKESGKSSKPKGWFSRRHQTDEAHRSAQALRSTMESRREEAKQRQAAREARSAREQWKILDQRLGRRKGAEKERARLKAIIAAERTS